MGRFKYLEQKFFKYGQGLQGIPWNPAGGPCVQNYFRSKDKTSFAFFTLTLF